jgi:Protein of unknown function (DUF2934)
MSLASLMPLSAAQEPRHQPTPTTLPETTQLQCPVCQGSHVVQEAHVLFEGGFKKVAYRCEVCEAQFRLVQPEDLALSYPTDDQIRLHAYYLYLEREREGRPGTALDDWLRAETALFHPQPRLPRHDHTPEEILTLLTQWRAAEQIEPPALCSF